MWYSGIGHVLSSVVLGLVDVFVGMKNGHAVAGAMICLSGLAVKLLGL